MATPEQWGKERPSVGGDHTQASLVLRRRLQGPAWRVCLQEGQWLEKGDEVGLLLVAGPSGFQKQRCWVV